MECGRRLRDLASRWRFEAEHADATTAELLNSLVSLVDVSVDDAFTLGAGSAYVASQIRRALGDERDPINQLAARSPQTQAVNVAARRELEAELRAALLIQDSGKLR